MNLYFPSALAMASNNTDVYVGKTWFNFGDEQSSLGQFRITRVEGASAPTRVVCDFAGEASYTLGGPNFVSTTYALPNLRTRVVGELKWEPNITVAAEYTGYATFAFVQAVDSNQQAGIFARDVGSSTWYTSTTFGSGASADYTYKMFIHTNAVGNPDPRVLLLNSFSVRFSNAYPSATSAVWALATTYSDGYAKYGFANKLGITTAVGVDGRVRYTTDGIAWLGTVIPGAAGTTLRCAAWSGDGTVCLAAGDNGVLATSSDGQTFALSSALQSTSGWGTRRAAAIAADPGAASVFYVVCGDGTVAKTTDYGATWNAVNNLFSVNQRYDGYSVEATPITCWFDSSYLFVSIYGGQVALITTSGTVAYDASNGFNGYTSSFGTPNITGGYVPSSTTPTGGIRAVFAGGLGRIRYVTPSGPFGSPYELGLMYAMINQGYNNHTVCSAYYDDQLDCTFVGLSRGVVAYRFTPLSGGSWQFYVVPGAVGDVVGIARVPGTTSVMAVEQSGYTATGTPTSPINLNWVVGSNLRTTIYPYYAAKVAANSTSIAVMLDDPIVAKTTDGINWMSQALPSSFPGGVVTPQLSFDPRAPSGFSQGLYIAFYQDSFYEYAATSPAGSGWTWQNLGYAQSYTGNLPTGTFTFGSPPVTIGIRPNGSGSISTNPTAPGAWGTTQGINNRNEAFPLPAFYYYPTSGVLFTGGVVTSSDTAYAVGKYGRFWVSLVI